MPPDLATLKPLTCATEVEKNASLAGSTCLFRLHLGPRGNVFSCRVIETS